MWLSDSQSKINKKKMNDDANHWHENLEIGVGLTAFGLFFMLMGVLLLFDAGLMAIGNVSYNRLELN